MIPLHYACKYESSYEVIEALINADTTESKESVTTEDKNGKTPLHYAAASESSHRVSKSPIEPDGTAMTMSLH